MANQALITKVEAPSIDVLYAWAKTQGNVGIAVLFVRAYESRKLTDNLVRTAVRVYERQIADGKLVPAGPRTEHLTRRQPPMVEPQRLVCTNSIAVREDETISPVPARENPWSGIYTVEHEDGHTTFRVKVQPEKAKFAPGATLIEVLVGQDNENDYTSFGFLRNGRVYPFKGFRTNETLLAHANAFLRDPEAALVSKRCVRCNRRLTTPESVTAGIGPECAKR